MDHARKVGENILNGESVGPWDRFKYFLGEFFVYGPLKNRMGLTRMKVGYTAGEAIGPEIFSFYRSLGLNLKQLVRPDRGLRVCDGTARWRNPGGYGRAPVA